MMNRYVEFLCEDGLLLALKTGKASSLYCITQKGFQFLQVYDTFVNLSGPLRSSSPDGLKSRTLRTVPNDFMKLFGNCRGSG